MFLATFCGRQVLGANHGVAEWEDHGGQQLIILGPCATRVGAGRASAARRGVDHVTRHYRRRGTNVKRQPALAQFHVGARDAIEAAQVLGP